MIPAINFSHAAMVQQINSVQKKGYLLGCAVLIIVSVVISITSVAVGGKKEEGGTQILQSVYWLKKNVTQPDSLSITNELKYGHPMSDWKVVRLDFLARNGFGEMMTAQKWFLFYGEQMTDVLDLPIDANSLPRRPSAPNFPHTPKTEKGRVIQQLDIKVKSEVGYPTNFVENNARFLRENKLPGQKDYGPKMILSKGTVTNNSSKTIKKLAVTFYMLGKDQRVIEEMSYLNLSRYKALGDYPKESTTLLLKPLKPGETLHFETVLSINAEKTFAKTSVGEKLEYAFMVKEIEY